MLSSILLLSSLSPHTGIDATSVYVCVRGGVEALLSLQLFLPSHFPQGTRGALILPYLKKKTHMYTRTQPHLFPYRLGLVSA